MVWAVAFCSLCFSNHKKHSYFSFCCREHHPLFEKAAHLQVSSDGFGVNFGNPKPRA
ncbi:hypothetical protein RchiOBHm_Chr2g0120411 [Rosa chinensis]|uniref:Uncharacterized protein n=1 Tax=Rosa chinensis TaxID=74649 RepID=A0A2P6RSA6_ROSCH|nr:hypothetical protein RchiOBHm_Chr2g0120411 [Rosa chinensis]